MNQGCYNGTTLEPSGVHRAVTMYATRSAIILNDPVAFQVVAFCNNMTYTGVKAT